jgi:transposase
MAGTVKYLGIDVHVKTSVWCLLDEAGQIEERGKVATTAPDLTASLKRLTEAGDILAGQEVGKLSYFVHDVCAAAGVKLLSFNAYQLRMIASSRKKTDTRDSYWLAKTLQTGMTPHPVYIPTGTVRLLRSLLSQRQALLVERRRWLARARAQLQGAGYKPKITRSVTRLLETAVSDPNGLDEYVAQALELCSRMEQSAEKELRGVEERLFELGKPIDAIRRLMTIPGIGNLTAIMIYAWVGDISRRKNKVPSQLESFRFKPDDLRLLEQLSRDLGVSYTEVIRRGLRALV